VCGGIGEERVAPEAGIPAAALGVEDPQLCLAARWPEPVAADDHLGSLADHVPAEPDPRSAGKLQAECRRRGDGSGQLPPKPRRLEDDEQHARPPGERSESLEASRQAGRPFGRMAGSRTRRRPGRQHIRGCLTGSNLVRQVDDQDVHGSSGQQRAGHRDAFIGRCRLEDDEPLEPHPAGNCLDRIEAAGKVHPGGDRTTGLGLGHQPQGQGGLPAGGLTA